MADHQSSVFTGPSTPEAFLADRQRMWSGFTHATTAALIFMVVLLVGMAIFLL